MFLQPLFVLSPPDSLRSSVQSSTLLYVVASRLTAKLSPVQYTPRCRRLQTHCEAQSSPVHSSMSSPPDSLRSSVQSSTLLYVVASRLTAKLSPVQYTPLCRRLQTHCEAQSSPVHSSMSSPPDSLRNSVQSSTLLYVVASRLTAKLSPVQYTPLCRRLQTHCEAQSSPVHSSMSSPPDSLRSSVQSSTLLYVVASRLTAKHSPVQYTPLCRRLQTHCEAQSSPVHSSMSSPPDSLRSTVQSSTLLYVVASRLTAKLNPVQYTPLCRRPNSSSTEVVTTLFSWSVSLLVRLLKSTT